MPAIAATLAAQAPAAFTTTGVLTAPRDVSTPVAAGETRVRIDVTGVYEIAR